MARADQPPTSPACQLEEAYRWLQAHGVPFQLAEDGASLVVGRMRLTRSGEVQIDGRVRWLGVTERHGTTAFVAILQTLSYLDRPPPMRLPRAPRQPARRLRGPWAVLEVLRTRELVDELGLGWLMASAGRFRILVGQTGVLYCPASGRIRVEGEPTRPERGLGALSRVLAGLAGPGEAGPRTLAMVAARFVHRGA